MPGGNNIDRRIIRTKEAIQSALVFLIDEVGFDALTVKDITTRAGIHRGTFYLHYRDKYDLLEQTENEVVEELGGLFLQASTVNLKDIRNIEQPLPMVVELFKYLKANACLMRAVLGIKGGIDFQDRIRKVLEQNLRMGVLSDGKPVTFLVPSEYLIAYIFSAHFGVIQIWLKKGCLESPLEMAKILSRLSLNGPIQAIVVESNG